MSQLICFDCHTFKRVIAPVVGMVVNRQTKKEEKHIVGWRCKKCVQKLYVGGAKESSEGNGWRRRLGQLIDAHKNAQIKKDMTPTAPVVHQENVEPVKKGMVNKIKAFFKRRTM
jgi:hypothetical protein